MWNLIGKFFKNEQTCKISHSGYVVTDHDSVIYDGSVKKSEPEKDNRGYTAFWVNPKKDIGICKEFSWVHLNDKCQKWCDEFIDELKHWDGCIKNNCVIFSNTNKKAIDKVQAICAVSGKRGILSEYQDTRKEHNRKVLYTLVISNTDRVDGAKVTRESIHYDGTVHCVSVPSKMIIVRRNGVVAVCGNTEHSVATNNILLNEKSGTSKLESEVNFQML